MMDWTDRHCRYFLRLISRRVLLYTEMVPTGALLRGDRERFLAHDPAEHPLAIQLGGSHPAELAQCARLAEEWGYDEVNLNVGCPSDRVREGRFGACLMAEPGLVADCVDAMRGAVTIPVTVKTRLGIDDRDSYEELCRFIDCIAAAGCRTFILHARKAWLKGLSPKENREIPPLRHDLVHQVKRDFPGLEIILNGGLTSLDQAEEHLNFVDGVMFGRAAYHNPYLLAEVDRRFYGETAKPLTRAEVLERFEEYVRLELAKGARIHHMTRHILGLYQSQPGARRWRQYLSTHAARPGGDAGVIRALGMWEPC
jgi:tRNA-dihydrouridine synthase A